MATDLHNRPNEVYPVQTFIYTELKKFMETPEIQALQKQSKKDPSLIAAISAVMFKMMSQARLEGFKAYFAKYNIRVMDQRSQNEQQARNDETDDRLISITELQSTIKEDNEQATKEATEAEQPFSDQLLSDTLALSFPLFFKLTTYDVKNKERFIQNILHNQQFRTILQTSMQIDSEQLDILINNPDNHAALYDQLVISRNLVYSQHSSPAPKPQFARENLTSIVFDAMIKREIMTVHEYDVPTLPEHLRPMFSPSGQSSIDDLSDTNYTDALGYIEQLFNSFTQMQQSHAQSLLNTPLDTHFVSCPPNTTLKAYTDSILETLGTNSNTVAAGIPGGNK